MSETRRKPNEEIEDRLAAEENERTLYQINTLSSSITADTTDIADLRFNNLEIGKTYKLTLRGTFSSSNEGDWVLNALHDGNIITQLSFAWAVTGAGDISGMDHMGTVIFTATATTITFDFDENTGSGANMNGNGTTNSSYAMLEELPDHQETSKWS